MIGYCLGIENRFNLCSGTDEETFELCRQHYAADWLPNIQRGEPSGIAMANGIALSMFRVMPVVTYNALLRYGASSFGMDQRRYPLVSVWDYVSYLILWITFKVASRSVIVVWIGTTALLIGTQLAIWFRSFHQWSLGKKYVGAEFQYKTDGRCPFELKTNYKNAIELNLR